MAEIVTNGERIATDDLIRRFKRITGRLLRPMERERAWVGLCAPSVDRIRAYALAEGLEDRAEDFFDYEEESGWMSGSKWMVDWQAAYRRFVRKNKEWEARRESAGRAKPLEIGVFE